MRVTIEFEDNTTRVFEHATRVYDSIEDGTVTVRTHDRARHAIELHNLRLSDVAAWTEEKS